MSKSPDAFRTISEVADWLETPGHVLRFWESKFSQVKPVKRAGGRRYYRPADMELLGGIKRLLHHDGLTIKEVQLLLREKGVKHVSGLSQPIDDSDTIEAAPADFVEAASPEEPVFSTIAPRKVETAPEPVAEGDDDQMSFPGFSFTSERAHSEPEVSAKPALQGIDISHIPAIDPASITTEKIGILGQLAKLSAGSLAPQATEIDAIKKVLASIASGKDS